MYGHRIRFFYMDFGDEIEKEVARQKENKRDREIAKLVLKGKCEFCGSDDNPWFDDSIWGDGSFMCYDCFYENLSFCADVAVPIRSASQMEGYMSRGEWEEKREEGIYKFYKEDFRKLKYGKEEKLLYGPLL